MGVILIRFLIEGGFPLGGQRRGGRGQDHLPPAPRRRLQVRQRAQGQGRYQGRPRGHVHAHDLRAGGLHAGLRAHRRRALHRLRRLQLGFAGHPPGGRRSQAAGDGRRRLEREQAHPPAGGVPARHGAGGEGRARGVQLRGGGSPGPAEPRREPPGRLRQGGAGRLEGHRQGLVVARGHEGRGGRVRGGVDGSGGPALHPVHLRVDGDAQGGAPYHRWVHDLRRDHIQVRLRLAGGRRLLVHSRYW